MYIWFKDKVNGEYRADSPMQPEALYEMWKAWQTGHVSSFRINVTIGRYPRSIHVENMMADRTFKEVIEQNFQQPAGEMSSWPPNAA